MGSVYPSLRFVLSSVVIAVALGVGTVFVLAPANEVERADRAIERYGFVDPVIGGWVHPGCGSLAECTAFTAVSPIDHLALSGFVACDPNSWNRDPADCIVHVDSRPFRPPPALEVPRGR